MNKRGSALMWAAIIGMIIAIIATSIAAVSASYYRRTVQAAKEEQAYLLSRSTAEMFAREIVNKTEAGAALLEKLTLDGECDITDISFGEHTAPGESCVVHAVLENDVISLTAVADIGILSKTVTVKLTKSVVTAAPTASRVFPSMYPGEDYTWSEWNAPASGVTPLKPAAGSDITLIGSGTSEDSSYYVGYGSGFISNSSKKTSIRATGKGNIYIYVNAGYSFYIDEILLSDEMHNVFNAGGVFYENAPTVYIILDRGANAYINVNNHTSDVFAYIYSPFSESSVSIGSQSRYNYTQYYGSIMAANYLLGGKKEQSDKVSASYIKPFNNRVGVSGVVSETGDWGVAGYEVS